MLYVRLAGDHLYEKLLFSWQSLVMCLLMSFYVFLFPLEMSWIRPRTEISQVLLPTLTHQPLSDKTVRKRKLILVTDLS